MLRPVVRTLSLSAIALSAVACGREKSSASTTPSAGLPSASSANQQAPNVFRVRFETSRGAFVMEAHRPWAPRGVDRLYQLVQSGFFDNARFFRVVSSFMVQFGVSGDPNVNAAWEKLNIPDDSVTKSNLRSFVSFAMAGPDTRTTQLFINTVDNRSLDDMGFAPVAQVIQGMEVVDSLYAGYGDGPPAGFGPDQMRLMAEGNAYLEKEFPKLDFIRTARLVEGPADSTATPPAGDSAAKGGAKP